METHFVIGEARTSSGINTWKVELDFKNYGKITGKYWFVCRQNLDSQISEVYSKKLKKHNRTAYNKKIIISIIIN